MAKKQVVYKNCSCCGEEKRVNSDNFYKSYSVLYKGTHENRMNICKECLLKVAHDLNIRLGSELKSLYALCQLTDTYFDDNIYDSAVEQAKRQNSNAIKIYYQKVVSLPQYKGKTFLDSPSLESTSVSNGEVSSNGNTDDDVISFITENINN